MDLNILWFALLGVLLSGYAILDGFDLGVGILHFVARDDRERRVFLNAIGPLWDGNEVWLVTFGGALFAAFPECYATAFSAFYTPFMLLLFALIFRAVSMEFRGKLAHQAWRSFWDASFSIASLVAVLLFGVAVGNAILGIPIDANRQFTGQFLDFLRPYPLLVGLFTVSMMALHGAAYLNLKTDGDLQARVQKWFWRCFWCFVTLYVLTTVMTLAAIPYATHNFEGHPWVWLIAVVNLIAIANTARSMYKGRHLAVFLSSACSVIVFNILFGLALFPDLLVSSTAPANSLNIYNAASSTKTLGIMAIIALLGMPFVIAYTAVIYWLFRGKVQVGKFSY